MADGLKYQLYADPCTQQLLTAGVVYELPVGPFGTRQGNGNGAFDIFLSGAETYRDAHWSY